MKKGKGFSSIGSLLVLSMFFSVCLMGQVPTGYYSTAQSLTGQALRTELHNIIDSHTVVSYTSLHNHYLKTDIKPNGKVWDMYSDVPGGTLPYQFTFITDKCGNYSQEGDCYNREHSWPQSWFNSASPMKSDLFHVYPTDGYVNGKRGNYPYGEVTTATWTSQNGSKVGNSSFPGYTGVVFEPIDEYKGDFARTFFYMSTRYYSEDNGWQNNDMVNGAEIKPWAKNMLLQWHNQDTVSFKEIARNDSVYQIQGNRNPFIDHPEYATFIWGTPTSLNTPQNQHITVFPNPAKEFINVKLTENKSFNKLFITNIQGQLVNTIIEHTNNDIVIDIRDLKKGIYFLFMIDDSDSSIEHVRLIKI